MRSIKLDLRFGGRLLSIKSKRVVQYCADDITVVKFPVPAKNSMKLYTWQQLNHRAGWLFNRLKSILCHLYLSTIWNRDFWYSRLRALICPKNHQDDQDILLEKDSLASECIHWVLGFHTTCTYVWIMFNNLNTKIYWSPSELEACTSARPTHQGSSSWQRLNSTSLNVTLWAPLYPK